MSTDPTPPSPRPRRRRPPGGPAIAAGHARIEQPQCVIPNCTTRVDEWGDTCPDCIDLFGSHLRPTGTRLTRDEIIERDSYVDRALHMQRQLRAGFHDDMITAAHPRYRGRR